MIIRYYYYREDYRYKIIGSREKKKQAKCKKKVDNIGQQDKQQEGKSARGKQRDKQ